MIPNAQLSAIGFEEGRSALAEFRRTLLQHNPAAQVYCAVHPEIGNIEFLAAFNSADGLSAPTPDLSEEEHARKFLSDHYALFRLHQEVFTPKYLVLKHTLQSIVGVHLVFEVRAEDLNAVDPALRDLTLDDACFVVHFDQRRRIVMISAVYEPDCVFDAQQVSPADVPPQVQDILKANPPLGDYSLERGLVSDPKTRQYRSIWRLKYLDQTHVARYYLLDQKGTITEYTVDPTAPPYWGMGQVYQRHWSKRKQEPALRRRVVLRDLTSDQELVGQYVMVQDEVDSTSPRLENSKENSPLAPGLAQSADESLQLPLRFVYSKDKSWFDRVMAYFHTNLVQHYFRELGLFELDRYDWLLPIRVVLSNGAISRFVIADSLKLKRPGWILLNRLDEDKEWTQAREARVIYHEFTHAVTDALARLHRGNLFDENYSRRLQVLQAAAMDEALGDYFACSLAAREGVAKPEFGILETGRSHPKWTSLRNLLAPLLSASASPSGFPTLRSISQPGDLKESPADAVIYRWGELWASYLWRLHRDPDIGPDNADILIANSIFFLTRWTTVAGGLLALMLVDDLLFDGLHLESIQDLARERGLDAAEFELGHWLDQTQTSAGTLA